MKRTRVLIGLLAVAALSAAAFGYEVFFSDAAGNKLGTVWEGSYVYVAVKDPFKGACGIDQFQADIVIFDFKTGAYINREGAWLRELGGIGSGLYFWVDAPGSLTKVQVPVGWRRDYTSIPGQVHVLQPGGVNLWQEGAWEYVDVNVPPLGNTLPATMNTNRINLAAHYQGILGRVENMDTLVLIVGDHTDIRNIEQDQIKIMDTVSKLAVTPKILAYGCGPACANIVVRIEDRDENLNSNEIEYVPFFVIINPGSWNQDPITGRDFCSLMRYGGVTAGGVPIADPIRWFNIYGDRFIHYAQAPWWDAAWPGVIRAVFFAPETAVSSGVFEFNFGNLEDFQVALGLPRDARLPSGTTFAFYYIDPNDFDDMTLATAHLGDRPRSEVFITDAGGVPLSEVKIGAGWGGLYIRVYDADANVNSCCQDRVIVHICDPHNEDDTEYVIVDEISNDSGIFYTQSGYPLLPVWDAITGYQLVFDDWKVQAFNEDTIFVRYNSVDYRELDIGQLGDGDPNDGAFPPRIDYTRARNQYWDVSFAQVKVYDYQVFDGTTHRMRFLDGQYRPVTKTIPLAGSLYLEVTDLDQNEHPGLREMIFGGWNRDANPDRNEHSAPVWGAVAPRPEDDMPPGPPGGGDEPPPPPPPTAASAVEPQQFFDRVVPGNMLGLLPQSITNLPATVKVFIFNAQRGTWERIDLRETGVNTGVFLSTTCVLVTDDRHPGDGNLGSSPGDTIMAFYQDPSNHSDISIISIKVSEGGAGGVVPPTLQLSVAFDRATYAPGDTVTITVTDEQYAGAMEITGPAKPLVLKKADGTEIMSWTTIPGIPGQPGKFRVTYVLPPTVTGTIIAVYTDPVTPTRTTQAQATVAAPTMTGVEKVVPVPEVFSTQTVFTVYPTPSGAVASKVTITVYDLTGRKVAALAPVTNSNTVTWNGGNLGNGAYIYVAEVQWPGGTKVVKGFVYIKR